MKSKYTIERFTFINQEIIYREKENHRTPICSFPARLNGERYWMNTFGELKIEIGEKPANICIESTLQTKRSIKLLVVALFNRIHIYTLDWARIRHHLKHLQIPQSMQCNVM